MTLHFTWVATPLPDVHYYKVTTTGTLHVNITKAIVNVLDGQVPALAKPCEPEDFNQAIIKVWEQFNSII